MLKELSKPRWSSWEGLCLKAAIEQKIQLKVIAAVLEKSVVSVSKKIRTLGLKEKNPKRGCLKGNAYSRDANKRLDLDVKNMLILAKTYAPSHLRGPQVTPKSLKETLIGKVSKKDCSYSLSEFLPYTLLEEKIIPLPEVEKGYDDSLYIPICYVEKWALLKGFQQTTTVLGDQGLPYWKKGRYFSKTQLLLHLNGIRLAKKLPPLCLHEEETQY